MRYFLDGCDGGAAPFLLASFVDTLPQFCSVRRHADRFLAAGSLRSSELRDSSSSFIVSGCSSSSSATSHRL